MTTAKKNSKSRGRIESFLCRRCGNCCSGEGFVSVSIEECRKIADRLDLTLDAFLDAYTTRKSAREYWLKDGPGEDQPCIFLERDARGLASCRIEGETKPQQCRDFPLRWRRRGFEQWCAGMRAEKDPSE